MYNDVNRTQTPPRMLTIRQVAQTGILPEHSLRLMAKAGQLPSITVGETKKILINYDRLVEQLQQLWGGDDVAMKTKLITRPSIAAKLMAAGFKGNQTINPWSPDRTAWVFDATPEFIAVLDKLDTRKKKGGDSSGKWDWQ